MGLLIPALSAGILARIRGIVLIILLIIVLLALGLGIVELMSLPFGGLGLAPGMLLGLFVAIAALAIVAAIGRAGATVRAHDRRLTPGPRADAA